MYNLSLDKTNKKTNEQWPIDLLHEFNVLYFKPFLFLFKSLKADTFKKVLFNVDLQ